MLREVANYDMGPLETELSCFFALKEVDQGYQTLGTRDRGELLSLPSELKISHKLENVWVFGL